MKKTALSFKGVLIPSKQLHLPPQSGFAFLAQTVPTLLAALPRFTSKREKTALSSKGALIPSKQLHLPPQSGFAFLAQTAPTLLAALPHFTSQT
ncbi:hypothetical protein [Bartonella sp. CB60]|uniref:hypothetical protein n=1 Tax=Bartonella sp. CB60 TaxID=3113619 RepID=UPI00300DCEC1